MVTLAVCVECSNDDVDQDHTDKNLQDRSVAVANLYGLPHLRREYIRRQQTRHEQKRLSRVRHNGRRCPNNFFQCQNGQCVNDYMRCDRRNDCSDHSDEENCENHRCVHFYFQCSNGYCVDFNRLCDFVDDCGDNSDEGWVTCGPTYILCVSTGSYPGSETTDNVEVQLHFESWTSWRRLPDRFSGSTDVTFRKNTLNCFSKRYGNARKVFSARARNRGSDGWGMLSLSLQYSPTAPSRKCPFDGCSSCFIKDGETVELRCH